MAQIYDGFSASVIYGLKSPTDRLAITIACLVGYAKQQKWPRGEIQTLRTFLEDMGAGDDPAGPEGPASRSKPGEPG